uniref:Transcription factor domain-containing protein n=1 Tax=Mycena chlorophos TaxID=658473 RepID=A0ABQ0L5A2_MYCCL|nr:predicted protein [Mycena chlorophos]
MPIIAGCCLTLPNSLFRPSATTYHPTESLLELTESVVGNGSSCPTSNCGRNKRLLLADAAHSPANRLYFLPVFDPSRIPSSEAPANDTSRTILHTAIRTMQCIAAADTCVEGDAIIGPLWTRISQWLQFWNIFPDAFPRIHEPTEPAGYSSAWVIANVIAFFCGHSISRAAMLATLEDRWAQRNAASANIWVLAIHSWAVLSQVEPPSDLLGRTFADLIWTCTRHLQKPKITYLSEGCGGSLDDYCRVLSHTTNMLLRWTLDCSSLTANDCAHWSTFTLLALGVEPHAILRRFVSHSLISQIVRVMYKM